MSIMAQSSPDLKAITYCMAWNPILKELTSFSLATIRSYLLGIRQAILLAVQKRNFTQ